MQPSLRIGIAGLGRLGMRHAQALAQQTRGCTLVAACSPLAPERDWATQQLGLKHTYESLEQMLAHPDLDAVVLVTPTSLHADQTVAVLQAGKHVFVEKPLALNVPDCERVLQVAQKHPNLMRPPSAGLHPNYGISLVPLFHFVITQGIFAKILPHGGHHFEPIVGVHPDSSLNIVAIPIENATNNGDIFLKNFPFFKSHGKVFVRPFLLGNEDGTRGVPIEPVDNSRPIISIDPA